jgi:hypothetical protein
MHEEAKGNRIKKIRRIMRSNGYIALRAWLESLGGTSDQLDRFLADEHLITLFIQRLLAKDWSENLPLFLEGLEIDLDAFKALAEDMAEQSLSAQDDTLVQLFAASNVPEYRSHLEFLISLRKAFYSLERNRLKKLSAEIEDQLYPTETDLKVAFNRIEAAAMKRRLGEIEGNEYGVVAANNLSTFQASISGREILSNANEEFDKEEFNSQTSRFNGKLVLRVAAILIVLIGSVWIFMPERESQFVDKGGERMKSEALKTATEKDSSVIAPAPGSEGNAPTIENAFDNKIDVSPAPPVTEVSYIASYEILGEVNRGFGFSKKRSIAVEVLSSMSQRERYSMQGDTLRLYVNNLNAFRNGTIIDIDRCLRDVESKSQCDFYISSQSGFYVIHKFETQAKLELVSDEQLITILRSYHSEDIAKKNVPANLKVNVATNTISWNPELSKAIPLLITISTANGLNFKIDVTGGSSYVFNPASGEWRGKKCLVTLSSDDPKLVILDSKLPNIFFTCSAE